MLSLSTTLTGDWITEATTAIEDDLKNMYAWLDKALEDKNYTRAREIKRDIRTYWYHYRTHQYTDVTDHPPLRTFAVIKKYIWDFYDGDSMPDRIAVCFERAARDYLGTEDSQKALSKLCEDDWLSDLYDEYGLHRLEKIKIPVVRQARAK